MSYRDPSAAIDDRVADLLGQMTIDEKLAQLGCVWITALVSGDTFDPDAAAIVLKDGIGHVTRIGASTGLRPEASATLMNAVQRVVVERTRLGIPVVVHEESTGGFCARDATVFPQGIGLASTWNPALVEEVAGVIREQLRAVGARHTLAPVLDVARDPRWGRVEETYGEDPVLVGTIGAAYVRGMQTDDLSRGVVATGKHFLGYAMSEGGMNHAPVHFGPRELREVYAEPFAAAIRDAGLASVMNSYSSVDGLPCAGSRSVLTGLLRDELGFDGVVVADYFSVALLISHHRVAKGRGDAARLALTAGLDMELPAENAYGAPLKAEIDAGRVDMADVDESVRRALRIKFRLGLFERPYVDAGLAPSVYDTPSDRSLARRAAAEALIVLTNRDALLPLDPGVGTIAVLGPGADDERLLQGDYHYPAHVEMVYEEAATGGSLLPEAGGAFAPGPYYTPHVTPLAGITTAVAGRSAVLHAKGCEVSGEDRAGIVAAAGVAAGADVAIVIVAGKSGLRPACTVGEARDAVDLDLTGLQADSVAAVVATGTKTVVVVQSGRVHTLAAVVAQADAVLIAWPPGEEGGNALADVLFGAVNPAGRLPVTLPRAVGQVPIYAGHRAGGGKSLFYGDYTDSPTSPLFAFGHGLSYTTFEYGPLAIAADVPIVASVRITNSGERAGDEVVQLYVTDRVTSVARPDLSLVGFTRVGLDPGEAVTVEFTVDPSRLAFYDEAMGLAAEPGAFMFSVGASSADIRAVAEYELTDKVAVPRLAAVVSTTVTLRS